MPKKETVRITLEDLAAMIPLEHEKSRKTPVPNQDHNILQRLDRLEKHAGIKTK